MTNTTVEINVHVKIGVSFHVDQSARLLSTNERYYSLAEKQSRRTARRYEKSFKRFVYNPRTTLHGRRVYSLNTRNYRKNYIYFHPRLEAKNIFEIIL